ncbi:hypothetical protein GH714_013781 [Hevea brasiliensis]|uniref:RecA family profile 1 domain-containing protein n=1 Tax=Hevea brasiliensis TaxID=3981 RepID=A0A6A6LJ21_HEVBR|nr:hypothetical protein GH714_013781 [Hevea brasiliensis]
MANKLISEIGLPKSIANIFAARNINTAKEALSLTEFELMELLDVGMADVTSAVAHISAVVSPPYQTFCLKISLLASLPASYGGLDGHVIYIDVESKFSSRRIIEIGATSFPEIFHKKGMAQEMAGRILVLRPTSLSEFTESLQQIKVLLLQQEVKLLVIDSMAALISGEYDQGAPRQHSLGWHISFVKSLAEFSRIPVVVTNQVRSQSRDEICQHPFQAHKNVETQEGTEKYDSHVVAALGIHWAHSVTIRLVLEAKSGHRYIKVAKSPISPPMAFPFIIASSGIALLDDDGIELRGQEINTIHCQGLDDIINFDGKKMK